MVDTASMAENIPFILLASSLIISLLIWAIRAPRWGVFLLVVSVLLGQVFRLPLPGQGGGFLVSDLAVVVVLLSASALYLRRSIAKAYRQKISWACLLLSPFIIWSLYILVVQLVKLDLFASLIAGSYWLRLTTNLLLIPALLIIASQPENRSILKQGISWTFLLLALFGFTQLVALPDLAVLGGGWDPHQSRLVTTWLDPNFSGALFMLGLWWFGWQFYQAESKGQRWVSLLKLALVALALLATQSRGSLVAVGLTGLLGLLLWLVRQLVWRKPIRLLPGGAIFFSLTTLALLASLWLGERLLGAVVFDPSALARLSNLESAWLLAQEVGWLGVGYNAYQFAAAEAGIGSSALLHSRAGADNSWLTLWITTGLAGVILFCLPWLTFLHWSFLKAWQGISVLSVVFLSILSLFLHAQLTNSFLYSHLLIIVALLIAASVSHHLWSRSESWPQPS